MLSEYFGAKFCSKIGKIKELVQKGETIVMPSSLWPMNVSVKPHNELSQHIANFSNSFADSNKKKKI